MNNLFALKDGKQLVREMLDIFRELFPRRLRAIAASMEKSDLPAIRRHTHALKSSASCFGATMILHLCDEMEMMASSGGNPEKVKALRASLGQECEQAIKEIESMLKD